jgi:hypothetical protein
MSLDKDLPQTPIQARAPNARAGLTDEAIPGDDPFLPSPKRHPSRLSKLPPTHGSISSPRGAHYGHGHGHARARSSRSSLRSFAEYGWAGSDLELGSPRASHEQMRPNSHSHSHSHHSSSHSQRAFGLGNGHSRVYSSSSVPPTQPFGDEAVGVAGLSPRPLFREDNIGRAIG